VLAVWPWLAVAGLGALHGLNPASGWLFAALRGVRARDRAPALRALVPIAVGHVVSVALVAAVVALGKGFDRTSLQAAGGVLLVLMGLRHLLRRRAGHAPAAAGQGGLAVWSFIVSTGHGAGLMLVPALIPLCTGAGAARAITASGSLTLALAAVVLHAVAMLAASGFAATATCRVFEIAARHAHGAGAGALRASAGSSADPACRRPTSD
jgi:hypothetical protein